jgi:hypothetical protein
MEQIKFNNLADQLITEICSLTKDYNEAIKNGKPFSEVKEIRKKIKNFTVELERLLSENPN